MIYAVLDTKDVARIKQAFRNVMMQVVVETDQLPRRAATEVRPMIAAAIGRNQYAAGYASYTAKYAAWKAAQGYSNTYWRLSGDLQSALKVFKYEDNWTAGIPGNVYSSRMGKRYSNNTPSSVEIAKYARVMEYGGDFGDGGKHPSRPLFRPLAAHYRVSRDFRNQGTKSLLLIARRWR